MNPRTIRPSLAEFMTGGRLRNDLAARIVCLVTANLDQRLAPVVVTGETMTDVVEIIPEVFHHKCSKRLHIIPRLYSWNLAHEVWNSA
jgi:hypothetical protein